MDVAVVGTSRVAMTPERGTLHLTVAAEADDKELALHDCTETVNHLRRALDEMDSTDPGPITWFAVLPICTRAWRPWNKDGVTLPLRYSAAAQIKVKFCDFTALSRFADTFGGMLFVRLDGVEWTLTDTTKDHLAGQVLAGAVRDAFTKAGRIAAAAGAGEVQAVEISDPGLLSGVVGSGGGRHDDLGMIGRGASAPASAGAPDAIELVPEDVELAAQVHARFRAA